MTEWWSQTNWPKMIFKSFTAAPTSAFSRLTTAMIGMNFPLKKQKKLKVWDLVHNDDMYGRPLLINSACYISPLMSYRLWLSPVWGYLRLHLLDSRRESGCSQVPGSRGSQGGHQLVWGMASWNEGRGKWILLLQRHRTGHSSPSGPLWPSAIHRHWHSPWRWWEHRYTHGH